MQRSSKTEPVYVLDANVFIEVEESEAFAAEASRFIATRSTLVSSVVVAELIIGSRSTLVRDRVIDNLRSQVNVLGDVTPTMDDWQTAANAWAKRAPGLPERRSTWNDLLLAASCARVGATLVTRNHADFRRIARHIPVMYAAPWPDFTPHP